MSEELSLLQREKLHEEQRRRATCAAVRREVHASAEAEYEFLRGGGDVLGGVFEGGMC